MCQVPGVEYKLLFNVDDGHVSFGDLPTPSPGLGSLEDEVSLLAVQALASLLALWAQVVIDGEVVLDDIKIEGRSRVQQLDCELLELALADGRLDGVADPRKLPLAHELIEGPSVVLLDVRLGVLQEAVPPELCAVVVSLVADAAGVFVVDLELDILRAFRTTLLRVLVERPLGLKELVARFTG